MGTETQAAGRSERPGDSSPRGAGADAIATKGHDSLGFVMDVPVELTVEIGRRTMKIADILRLGAGSVLELNKAAGEPLDICVNNRPIARGEAVVVGDHYGVRITEVLVSDDHSAKTGRGE